jgi:hypothetical protein
MSYDDTVVAEVDADPIDAPNPIADLLSSIESGEYTDAEQAFNDIIGDRLQDTLDQTKVRIADQIFNAQHDIEDDPDDDDLNLDLDLDLDDDFEEEDDNS